ncbi:methyltransferase [Kitasatospora purpeofusca]|uniref:methyltransferase n=1 Tax=Kitasatospora purpeofusca TaxID=67352 RepID=UPI002A5A1C0C|nr:methyltransferase [Kitasatospora purpeofusca]MDY0814376.1 methyltransferase [Kitasatospora purpeofusca]
MTASPMTASAVTPPAVTATATAVSDSTRLRASADFVRRHDTATLLPLLLPGLDGPQLHSLTGHLAFTHAALLVFPPDPATLRADLAACGLAADTPPLPSSVVRDRLALRHRRDAAGLDVSILRPEVRSADGTRRAVEVFALTVPPGSDLWPVAEHERAHQHEAHLAFEVLRPEPLLLRGLCALLAEQGAVPDGGGYNPHENGTVLYFTAPAASLAGYRRVELYAPGDHRDVLAGHLADGPAGYRADRPLGHLADGPADRPGTRPSVGPPVDHQPAETLLRLLTGAWATQALAACARLRLPDAIPPGAPIDRAALARRTGTHPRALATLLRYLAMLGVVTAEGERVRLTEVGALLREDAPASMRPLALMYGGPFYRSFGALDHTVRTGETAFDHLFGENHFDHFARDPELADLFDRSMAASTRMFDPVPAHPALAAAAARPDGGTVVDVAGGNGELLARVLAAHPGLRGVLLERPHAVEAARRTMAEAGCADRCTYRVGDFADVPAEGDVYLLSRVLHDWDDDRCRAILRHCERAMPAHADLLVVERLLPADGSASLATAWDVHMMCNVGGRERRADHYADLLAAAGLDLLAHTPLPLDAALLYARRPARP